MPEPLPADREALALELAQLLQQQSLDTFLQVARTLVQADDAHLFGNTEFQVRDPLLKLGLQAYNALLEQKKTATTAPACPAPTAAKRPASTATGRGGP